MRQILAKIRSSSLRWVAACLLGASAMSAQALVTVTPGAASGQPDTDVVLTTTVDIGPGALFDSIFFAAYYDTAALTLNSLSMTLDGQPFVLSSLAPFGQVSTDPTAGAYAFSFRAQIDFNNPLPPVPLEGQLLISMNYHLDAAMVPGTDTQLAIQFTSVGTNADANQFSYTTISAVPEPESWVLALVGLPLVVSLARRRARLQRA